VSNRGKGKAGVEKEAASKITETDKMMGKKAEKEEKERVEAMVGEECLTLRKINTQQMPATPDKKVEKVIPCTHLINLLLEEVRHHR